jgi:membrane protein
MKKWVEVWKVCRDFLRKNVWEVRCCELSWPRRAGVYAVRLASLVVSGFKSDQCSLHAASLTFFSLMALIPILALTLAMARSFGGAELARKQVNDYLSGWLAELEVTVETQVGAADGANGTVAQAFSTQVLDIADQLFNQLDQLRFGTIGGIGAIILLWTVISTLGKVETSFNQVWGVEHSRSLVRKCADYLLVCMTLPFLVTAASSVPVAAMITRFAEKTAGSAVSGVIGQFLHSGVLKLSVAGTLGGLAFAFLLGFMPNTRVRSLPALTGGFITAGLFGAWLKLCTMLQIGIAKYSALYGSFAVLPILLLWVYISWQIILLGAEITFAIQNRDTYILEQNAADASLRARLLLALTLCAETARRASEKDGGPFAAETFAQRRGIPSRFVKDILDDLVRNRILVGVAGCPGEYLLYRCGRALTVADVTKVMLDDGKPLDALGLNNLSGSLLAFSGELDDAITRAFPTSVDRL